MQRTTLINNTVNNLSKLPDDKVKEVSDYADFILKKYEEEVLQEGMSQLVSNSKAYKFLEEDEDLYTVSDLIEVYNGNRTLEKI